MKSRDSRGSLRDVRLCAVSALPTRDALKPRAFSIKVAGQRLFRRAMGGKTIGEFWFFLQPLRDICGAPLSFRQPLCLLELLKLEQNSRLKFGMVGVAGERRALANVEEVAVGGYTCRRILGRRVGLRTAAGKVQRKSSRTMWSSTHRQISLFGMGRNYKRLTHRFISLISDTGSTSLYRKSR